MDVNRRSSVVTAVVFLLSGSAALIFETAWFRIVGLALGSSVWSAAAILMAFMTGLGIGNLLVASYGHRIRRPFVGYAAAEVLIGVFGLASVVFLPYMTPLIARWLASLISDQTLLNAARFGIAFSIFLIPAIAMGATLPILQKGLFQFNKSFSKSLAHLYGHNTIGAVGGALLSEFLLIELVGITGAAGVACVFNLIAALILVNQFKDSETGTIESKYQALSETIYSLRYSLIPPFLTGLALLALEVIWFRYLLLTQNTGSAVFAIMLAVVLAGIGLGGIIASRLKIVDIDLDRLIFRLCLLSTVVTVLGFYLFSQLYANFFDQLYAKNSVLILEGAILMLPSCILSGMLFPLFGERLHRKIGGTTSPSGALTFANTIGSAIGTGLATFLLLPILGVEYSILALSLVYTLVALIVVLNSEALRQTVGNYLTPALALAMILVLFPYGTLSRSYAIFSDNVFPEEKLVAVKEGLNETLQYYRSEQFGQPVAFRLVTNAHSMAATNFWAQRYMRMFAYMPYFLHQEIKSVLQISYGVGVTAEAVVSLPQLQHFDIVDISEDVLFMSKIMHDVSGSHPQRDPRTQVHIEDGRFFLQTTGKTYDLITAEPPPPKNAGVVNLYSQEYFQLIRSRLNEGGVTSYWLPAGTLKDGDMLAIIKAFCNVFPDCSMWNSVGLEFMLVGSKSGINPSLLETAAARWTGPIGEEMRKIGLEKPGQLGAMFMADAQQLQQLTDGILPVVDNFPLRISNDYVGLNLRTPTKAYLIDPARRINSFMESSYIRSIFPQTLIDDSLGYFHLDSTYVNLSLPRSWKVETPLLEILDYLLTETELVVLPTVLLGSNPAEQRLLNEIAELTSVEHYESAITRAFVARNYAQATSLLEFFLGNIEGEEKQLQRFASLYYLSRALAGNLSEAELLADKNNSNFKVSDRFVEWMQMNHL